MVSSCWFLNELVFLCVSNDVFFFFVFFFFFGGGVVFVFQIHLFLMF